MTQWPHFDFTIGKTVQGTQARRGTIWTPHGDIETPNFIFCATRAAIKGASPRDLKEHNADIILSNTYHLMLQPGPDIIAKRGGLQKFTGWNGPMLTDSGGFQIFSLGHGGVANEIKGSKTGGKYNAKNKLLSKITEDGAYIRSYINGEKHFLSPEKSIEIQRKLGADLILVLDECTPFHASRDYTARSLNLTHRWAKRSLNAMMTPLGNWGPATGSAGPQALYGISQGGIYEDLRTQAANFLNDQPFFGQAVGGSLGGTPEQMYEVVAMAMAPLRKDRPTHLLGIGGVRDIWEGVAHGVDTFDCVSPTRLARHGWALTRKTKKYRLNLRNARFADDENCIDDETESYAGQFSRSYIHHLIKAGEFLGTYLLTLHNIAFMTRLLNDVRTSIDADCFEQRKAYWLNDHRIVENA